MSQPVRLGPEWYQPAHVGRRQPPPEPTMASVCAADVFVWIVNGSPDPVRCICGDEILPGEEHRTPAWRAT